MTPPRRRPALETIGPPRSSASHRASFDARLIYPPPSAFVTRTPTTTSSGASSRRSFLGGFADLATLLRSHRGSGRKSRRVKHPDITSNDFFSASAGQPVLDQPIMHSNRTSSEQTPANKLYNFLTRSRSRSRSKQEQPGETPTTLPTSRGSKPASRIPSRPLSSTTTATNTTVTPATPRPRKQRMPVPDPVPSSRPTTPKASATRQKLQDLFGISLLRKGGSRSRSRSRPSSPVGFSGDAPPVPGTHRKSRIRTPSPTPVLRVTNATNTSSTGSTAASISTKTPRPSTAPNPTGPPVLPPIPPIVSRVSSLHRRSSKDLDRPQNAPTPPPKITRTPATPLRPGTSTGTVSASTSGSSSRALASTNTSGSSVPTRPGHATKASLDSNYRFRGTAPPMRAVAEEGASPPPQLKGKTREPIPRTNGTKISNSVRATKHGSFDFERPGGWNGPIAMQRSGSGGTSASGASRRSGTDHPRERESVYGPGLAGVGTLQREVSMKRAEEREALLRIKERVRKDDKQRTRGSTSQRTTPDTVHASTSSASAANGKSSSMGRAAGRRTAQLLPKRLVGLASAQHGPFPFEPAVPSPTRSTGTASTGTAHEVAVPAGRAEKELARLRDEKERARSGLFGRRRSGDRAPVPVPLPVVPPTPLPPSTPDSPGPIPIPMQFTLSAMLDGAPPTAPSAQPPRTSRPSAGHRSGTKGRSLDLGLGLLWAPSKVREEALLPKSGFFARTPSMGSASSRERGTVDRGTRTAGSRPVLGRSASVNHGGEPEGERARLGREVAEVFRSTLDGEGYKTFKGYVHQFDAHEIPFDGPLGIVVRVEDLLLAAPRQLGEDARKRLLDKFVRIILQVA